MELWMRSQDKNYLIPIKDTISVFREGVFYNGVILGTYKTKERALEVLDEIQDLLQPKISYIQKQPVETITDGLIQIKQDVDMKIQELSTIVYQMPKE